MSAGEKTVTEREAVLREREAFLEGVVWERARPRFAGVGVGEGAHAAKASRYPLPRVTRPREVSYGSRWFKVVDGEVHCRPRHLDEGHGAGWTPAATVDFIVNRAFVTMCADLLANPTEEVDA